MSKRLNWTAVAGLSAGLAAVVGYFTLVTPWLGPRVPWLRDVPVLNFTLLAAGLWLSWRGMRAGGWPARVAGATNLLLAGLFAFYVLEFSSRLPAGAGAPRTGQPAPEIALVSHRGETVTLGALRGAPVVLVFYRGFW